MCTSSTYNWGARSQCFRRHECRLVKMQLKHADLNRVVERTATASRRCLALIKVFALTVNITVYLKGHIQDRVYLCLQRYLISCNNYHSSARVCHHHKIKTGYCELQNFLDAPSGTLWQQLNREEQQASCSFSAF